MKLKSPILRQILRQLRRVVACMVLAVALPAPTSHLHFAHQIAAVVCVVDAAVGGAQLGQRPACQRQAVSRLGVSIAQPASGTTFLPGMPRQGVGTEPPVAPGHFDGRYLYLANLALLC